MRAVEISILRGMSSYFLPSFSSLADQLSIMHRCNIFSTIHVCAYLLRPSGLIGTIT
jgi:hypothetical protein